MILQKQLEKQLLFSFFVLAEEYLCARVGAQKCYNIDTENERERNEHKMKQFRQTFTQPRAKKAQNNSSNLKKLKLKIIKLNQKNLLKERGKII